VGSGGLHTVARGNTETERGGRVGEEYATHRRTKERRYEIMIRTRG